jgi:hypothetical protein
MTDEKLRRILEDKKLRGMLEEASPQQEIERLRSEIARLRLADEERECLEWAEEIAGNCEEFDRVDTLRGLLERLK